MAVLIADLFSIVARSLSEFQATVSTIYEMSDGGSLVVMADDALDVEEAGQGTRRGHVTINVSCAD